MKTHKVWLVGIVLAGVLLMLQAPLGMVAQEPPPQEQGQPPQDQGQPPQDQGQAPQEQGPENDPPSRVARLSYSSGSVSFQPGGEGDWAQAVNNRPLTTGDNLWADKDSRAELQTGSTSIRMDSETSLTLLELGDRTTQLKLSQGSIIVRVRHLDDDDSFEVDTPNLAFQVQRTGEYRISVNADGNETDTTVWHGRGEATGGGDSYVVVAGQRARFTGADQLDHEISQIPRRDDFDEWAFNRDHHEDHSESSNYISSEMTGAEDLDEYGHWRYVADYGPVWTPSAVAPGWAPYRYGHWVWVEPWGWTWVEDEPWGFAPFHYGRWAFVESSWCWVPGPVYARPVYAPALVAFVGGGGFGAGVAWFPLAPREVFVPSYRTSRGYVNNVNVTNTRVNVTQVTNVYNTTVINNRTTNITNNNTNVTRITYANQRVGNAVTAVSHETFVNARPVAANINKVDPRQIENAPVVHNMGLQPVRASVMGAGRPVNVKPSATIVNRQVVAIRQPAPPRASFEQRQNAAPNVRTEAPGRPQPGARTPVEEPGPGRPGVRTPMEAARPEQPAVRTPTDAPRPGQPAARPSEVPRAQEPAVGANQPSRPQVPPSPGNNRPGVSPSVPRPGVVPPQETPRQPEPVRPADRSLPRPPAGDYGRPQVRPAPPVRDNPQQQQNEQSKFNAWQQQRQNMAPRQAARPPEPPRTAQPQPRTAQPQHPGQQPSARDEKPKK
jgi:FecR protein